MKIAHKATGCAGIGKWYQFTNYADAIEFERLLKPLKGYVSGDAGDNFSEFKGGTENA